jgi:ribosomal protein S27AE
MEAFLIPAISGILSAFVGRWKGSSFFIWLAVGTALPFIGLIAAILYRNEGDEPERACPRCGTWQKLHVQVCRRCGEDLFLPDPSEVRPGR